jgi:ATP-dependent Lon protease
VLPVGGVREKLFAAHRAGLREVMIPFDNQRDLQEVPAEVLGELRVIAVRTVDEALSEILTPLAPIASSMVSIAS